MEVVLVMALIWFAWFSSMEKNKGMKQPLDGWTRNGFRKFLFSCHSFSFKDHFMCQGPANDSLQVHQSEYYVKWLRHLKWVVAGHYKNVDLKWHPQELHLPAYLEFCSHKECSQLLRPDKQTHTHTHTHTHRTI